MMNEGKLKAGQVVKLAEGLHVIKHVNDCRAWAVPLSKKAKADDVFGVEKGGTSIAATSFVEIVEDLDRARTEIELAEAEAELREAREALALKAAPAAPVPQVVVKPAKVAPAPVTVTPSGSGWRRSAKEPPAFKEGTLASKVMAFIVANPGLDTKTIVVRVEADGAIAACVSRFHQAGLIERC